MTRPYPIVDQRPLAPSPKRDRLGLRRRYREADEIPTTQAHQVLVYRVNGDYVLDRADRGLTHEDVVAATHVSVVDVRQDHPVFVELDIPSAEASEFRVRATFICTVDDAVQVVRRGVYDAAEVLTGYVKSHHRIFELGLDYEMAQLTEVRRDVKAQMRAYTTFRPPVITGMTVKYLDADVLTPEELARFQGTRREQRFSHTIAAERQGFDHLLQYDGHRQEQARERDRLTHEHDRQYAQQRHEQFLAAERQRDDQFLAAERQQKELLLEQERREFARRELAKAVELLGDDPLRALHLAHASGQLSPLEFAGELQADKDRKAKAEEVLQEREREDRLRIEQWKHEERQSEIAARQAKELQEALWAREDILRREQRTYEDEQRMFEASLQVMRELNKSGHLDLADINLDLNRILDRVTGGTQAGNEREVETLRTPALPEGGHDDAADIDVREEDGD